jgi:hypothetical protein
MPGRFQSVVRLERPAIEKKYWKEFSGRHRISLRAVAVPASSILQEYIGQRKTHFNFSRRLAVPYILALKGEVLRHDG